MLLLAAAPLTSLLGYLVPALVSNVCFDVIDGCGDYSVWLAYRDLWTYSVVADVVFVLGVLASVLVGWVWHRQRAWRGGHALLVAVGVHAAILTLVLAGLVATGYWFSEAGADDGDAWPVGLIIAFSMALLTSFSLALAASTTCLVLMIRLQPGPYGYD